MDMLQMDMLTGRDIVAIRQAIGLSRTQLASMLNVTEGAVWKWEADQQHPRWGTMIKLNELREKIRADAAGKDGPPDEPSPA